MNELVIAAFSMSGIILLINASTWKGMLFDKIYISRKPKLMTHIAIDRTIKNVLDDFPSLISSPLWDCIICMSPWWSIAVGWPLFFGSYIPGWANFEFIGLVAFINVIVDTFVLGKREGL